MRHDKTDKAKYTFGELKKRVMNETNTTITPSIDFQSVKILSVEKFINLFIGLVFFSSIFFLFYDAYVSSILHFPLHGPNIFICSTIFTSPIYIDYHGLFRREEAEKNKRHVVHLANGLKIQQ